MKLTGLLGSPPANGNMALRYMRSPTATPSPPMGLPSDGNMATRYRRSLITPTPSPQANGGAFPGGGMGQPTLPTPMGQAPQQGNAYGRNFREQWGMPFGQAQQGFEGDRTGGLRQMLQDPQFLAYLRSRVP